MEIFRLRSVRTWTALACLGVGLLASPAAADDLEPNPPLSTGFQLKSALNNKCLEIMGGHGDNGAPLGMWECAGRVTQRWHWDGLQLRSDLNNRCLEVKDYRQENGSAVGLWDCWGGTHQRWHWDGLQLRSQLNNKCLDVLGFNSNNGAQAGMWDCGVGTNQRWFEAWG